MFNKEFISIFILACFVLVFTECASIFKGSKQKFPVISNPSNATVIIKNKDGNDIFKCETPCEVTLKKNDLRKGSIIISKDGYETVTLPLGEKIEGWCWGNILLGGIIGWLIDVGTGSWKKADVEKINLDLNKSVSKLYIDENNNLIVEITNERNEYKHFTISFENNGENAYIAIYEH